MSTLLVDALAKLNTPLCPLTPLADPATDPDACARIPLPADTAERRLGDSELSYYLPSRADGVNDM